MITTRRARQALLLPFMTLALLLAGAQAQAAFAPPLGLTKGVPDLQIIGSVLNYNPSVNPDLTINATYATTGSLENPAGVFTNYFVGLTTNIYLTTGQLDAGTGSTLTVTGYRSGDPATPVTLLSGYLFRFGVANVGENSAKFEGMIKITDDVLGFNTRHAGFQFVTTTGLGTGWDHTSTLGNISGTYDVFAVPVPAPLALIGLGLIGLRLLRRRA